MAGRLPLVHDGNGNIEQLQADDFLLATFGKIPFRRASGIQDNITLSGSVYVPFQSADGIQRDFSLA